jgi:hypothetical protein
MQSEIIQSPKQRVSKPFSSISQVLPISEEHNESYLSINSGSLHQSYQDAHSQVLELDQGLHMGASNLEHPQSHDCMRENKSPTLFSVIFFKFQRHWGNVAFEPCKRHKLCPALEPGSCIVSRWQKCSPSDWRLGRGPEIRCWIVAGCLKTYCYFLERVWVRRTRILLSARACLGADVVLGVSING